MENYSWIFFQTAGFLLSLYIPFKFCYLSCPALHFQPSYVFIPHKQTTFQVLLSSSNHFWRCPIAAGSVPLIRMIPLLVRGPNEWNFFQSPGCSASFLSLWVKAKRVWQKVEVPFTFSLCWTREEVSSRDRFNRAACNLDALKLSAGLEFCPAEWRPRPTITQYYKTPALPHTL